MTACDDRALCDVRRYPEELLGFVAHGIRLPLTYKKSWDDGFGARGWKLNATIGDPQIIASTRVTGARINTSVLVHDILDHFLSGYTVSGHRSEAMALTQLAMRTGSDPGPDYEQMVNEDIMRGLVNRESLASFLPRDLQLLLPYKADMSETEIISLLKNVMGEKQLSIRLVRHFHSLGESGKEHAVNSWYKLGLERDKQRAFGTALQKVLEQADTYVEEMDLDYIEANGIVSNSECLFALKDFTDDNTDLIFQSKVL